MVESIRKGHFVSTANDLQNDDEQREKPFGLSTSINRVQLDVCIFGHFWSAKQYCDYRFQQMRQTRTRTQRAHTE